MGQNRGSLVKNSCVLGKVWGGGKFRGCEFHGPPGKGIDWSSMRG